MKRARGEGRVIQPLIYLISSLSRQPTMCKEKSFATVLDEYHEHLELGST